MKWGIVIAAFCFVIGGVVWPFFNEPKIYYIPLSVLLLLLWMQVKKNATTDGKYIPLFYKYFILLSYGFIIKQVMYTEKIRQINDYIWGGFITIWLLINLIKLKKWEITNRRTHGRK